MTLPGMIEDDKGKKNISNNLRRNLDLSFSENKTTTTKQNQPSQK